MVKKYFLWHNPIRAHMANAEKTVLKGISFCTNILKIGGFLGYKEEG